MEQEKLPYFIHPSAVVDAGAQIGANTRIWHFCHIMSDVVLGEDCNLGQNVFIADGVRLGRRVKVQNNVSLYSGVLCEDDVFIGPSAVFTNVRNPRSAVVRRGAYETTYLEQGATIGANATIVCGVRIGAYAFVGAGAVITKDILPYALVVGNPSRQIGWMSRHGHRLHFDAENRAVCPETGEEYVLQAEGVKMIAH